MKAYVLVDDFIKELNQKYKGSMTDICLMPLGVENWLRERAAYPVQLHLHSKETPDPELDTLIENLKRLCAYYEDEEPGVDYRWSRNHTKAITIRHWKRHLKKKARSYMRQRLHKEMEERCYDY